MTEPTNVSGGDETPPADLRPWGYAPGGYSFQCQDCPKANDFMDRAQGAKRSWRCLAHAIEAWRSERTPPAQVGAATDSGEGVKREHIMPGDPVDLGQIALQWYLRFEFGYPHSTRESNIAVEGFKDGFRAALASPNKPVVEAVAKRKPDAWMYVKDGHGTVRKRRWIYARNRGWTEIPLYASMPSTDQEGLVDALGEPCAFVDCPPGLFRWQGLLCFKSEYSTKAGQPDAYCVDTGEYFWGGTSGDLEARRQLTVIPVCATRARQNG